MLLGREEEVLQQLGGCERTSATEVYPFGPPRNGVDHALLLVEDHALLRVVAKLDGLAYVKPSAVGLFQSQQQFDESGLSGTIGTHYAHLLKAGEVVIEVLENDFAAVVE